MHQETPEPNHSQHINHPGVIAHVIHLRSRDLGGFSVGRVLPDRQCQMIGPFIFFDHIGPALMEPGSGVNVRPHPHINLATVTYLFEGEIIHRDSLGYRQAIHPGAINWMTAGRGIVHSERTDPRVQSAGHRLHGIQLWVALPREHEEVEPNFHHHAADSFSVIERNGAHLRVLAGSAYGKTAPVRTYSPLCYVDITLAQGGRLELPNEYQDRAIYLIAGSITCDSLTIDTPQMLVFRSNTQVQVEAQADSRLILLGGVPLEGERHLWWNFVSSSKLRIEQAKRDWREGRFAKVPGDEDEFIPLPE